MMEIKRDGTMFYCGDSKNPLAKITFYYQDNLIVVDHTYFSPALRGQKIGQKLLSEIIFLAKSEGKSIDPKCSFVKKELNNDSEHKNLIYQKNTKEEKNSENSKYFNRINRKDAVIKIK